MLVALIPLAAFFGEGIFPRTIPGLMIGCLVFRFVRRVRTYEVLESRAKEGFQVVVRSILRARCLLRRFPDVPNSSYDVTGIPVVPTNIPMSPISRGARFPLSSWMYALVLSIPSSR